MNICKHPSFSVMEHDECPDCGETDVLRIIDERHIATLDAEIEMLRKAAAFVIDCYADGDWPGLKDAVTRLRDTLAGEEGT